MTPYNMPNDLVWLIGGSLAIMFFAGYFFWAFAERRTRDVGGTLMVASFVLWALWSAIIWSAQHVRIS